MCDLNIKNYIFYRFLKQRYIKATKSYKPKAQYFCVKLNYICNGNSSCSDDEQEYCSYACFQATNPGVNEYVKDLTPKFRYIKMTLMAIIWTMV